MRPLARTKDIQRSARRALARIEASLGIQRLGELSGAVPVTAMAYLEEICRDLDALRCQGGWMTLDDAERYAHVRSGALREAVRAGEIKCYRRREYTTTIVRAEDVDEWIRTTWLDAADELKEK